MVVMTKLATALAAVSVSALLALGAPAYASHGGDDPAGDDHGGGDNGSVAASGSAKTGGRSGSFSVERKIANRAGTDKVTFRATHGGEVCSGTIAF